MLSTAADSASDSASEPELAPSAAPAAALAPAAAPAALAPSALLQSEQLGVKTSIGGLGTVQVNLDFGSEADMVQTSEYLLLLLNSWKLYCKMTET